MRVLIALVLFLMPLLIAPALFFHFDTEPKLAVLLFGASALLLFHRANMSNIRDLRESRPGRWFMYLLAVGWVSFGISTAVSTRPALSVFGTAWRGFGLVSFTATILFALFFAGWLSASPRHSRFALRVIACAGVLAGAYGISQYFGCDPLLPAGGYRAGEGPFTIVRPPGTLGHADYFAAWLAMVLFCDLALARVETQLWARRFAAAAAALAGCAIVFSGTRAALLGVAAGGVYAAVRLHLRPHWRAAGVMATVAVAFALFVISPQGAYLRARAHWSLEDPRGGARLLLWRDSIVLAGHHPVFGHGPETFSSEFSRVQSVELARAFPDFYHESPHNMFLDALAGQGILGAAVLIGLCALGWHTQRGSASASTALLGAGFLGAIVCHQFTVFMPATFLFFVAILALLAASLQSADRPPAPATQTKARVLIPIEAAVALMLCGWAVRILVADSALASVRADLNRGNVADAMRGYEKVRRWRWPAAASDLFYSRSMAALALRLPAGPERSAAWREAIDSGRRATATAEDPQNAWYSLAVLLSAAGDGAGVENALRAAAAAGPAWFKPRWALAQLLQMTGRHAEAVNEAAAAMDRDGGKDPQVFETWKRLKAGAL